MLSANVSNKHHIIVKETSSASDDLTCLSGVYKSPAATIKYCHTQSWQYNTCLESKVLTEICFCRHPGQNAMVLTEMCHIWQELSALFWFEFWLIRTFFFSGQHFGRAHIAMNDVPIPCNENSWQWTKQITVANLALSCPLAKMPFNLKAAKMCKLFANHMANMSDCDFVSFWFILLSKCLSFFSSVRQTSDKDLQMLTMKLRGVSCKGTQIGVRCLVPSLQMFSHCKVIFFEPANSKCVTLIPKKIGILRSHHSHGCLIEHGPQPLLCRFLRWPKLLRNMGFDPNWGEVTYQWNEYKQNLLTTTLLHCPSDFFSRSLSFGSHTFCGYTCSPGPFFCSCVDHPQKKHKHDHPLCTKLLQHGTTSKHRCQNKIMPFLLYHQQQLKIENCKKKCAKNWGVCAH